MDEFEMKNVMRKYGLRPKDYMGQNFLIDQDVLDVIVNAADLKKSETVLEVGPGLGVLTVKLAEKVKKVLAVEKDERLVRVLKKEIAAIKNVEIFNADILRFNIQNVLKGEYKVVANIPYYLTSKLIANLLALEKKPQLMVLMLQKEVAERIVAPAGKLSILGISVQFYADVEIVAHVPKENFWPAPEVDSAIIRIEPKEKYPNVDEKLFFRVIKIAFAGKRKQLHNTLAAGMKISKEESTKLLADANINPNARPQELTIEDWLKLSKEIK